MPRIDENYALARIDLPGASTHGWQVRLQRRGVKYAKYFGDGVHGGAQNALDVARAWRNELLRQIEASEQARICTRSVRNRSGVVGVSKVTVVTNGASYQFWHNMYADFNVSYRSVNSDIDEEDRSIVWIGVGLRMNVAFKPMHY